MGRQEGGGNGRFSGVREPRIENPKTSFFSNFAILVASPEGRQKFFFKKNPALIQSFELITINMSTTVVSHSEPVLFLTKDQQVQVRAHTTADGSMFFCVSDFIRHMLVEEVSNDRAVRLWMDITLCNGREVSVRFAWFIALNLTSSFLF